MAGYYPVRLFPHGSLKRTLKRKGKHTKTNFFLFSLRSLLFVSLIKDFTLKRKGAASIFCLVSLLLLFLRRRDTKQEQGIQEEIRALHNLLLKSLIKRHNKQIFLVLFEKSSMLPPSRVFLRVLSLYLFFCKRYRLRIAYSMLFVSYAQQEIEKAHTAFFKSKN